jgi:hypothetical protein
MWHQSHPPSSQNWHPLAKGASLAAAILRLREGGIDPCSRDIRRHKGTTPDAESHLQMHLEPKSVSGAALVSSQCGILLGIMYPMTDFPILYSVSALGAVLSFIRFRNDASVE